MKYLKKFLIFESQSIENYLIDIINLLDKIGIESSNFIEWWNNEKNNIEIYFFEFKNRNIVGGIIGKNKIALNSKHSLINYPVFFLFILVHESKHIEQYNDGKFDKGYFQTVLNNDKEEFLKYYIKSEKEANDYGIEIMKELGFNQINNLESMIRSNEKHGLEVFEMIKRDIEKYNSESFFDLILKQII
jgi:hypothetical protein